MRVAHVRIPLAVVAVAVLLLWRTALLAGMSYHTMPVPTSAGHAERPAVFGVTFPEGVEAVRAMGIVPFPGAVCEGLSVGHDGPRRGRQVYIAGAAVGHTPAPYRQVVQFYLDQYREQRPAIRTACAWGLPESLVIWDDYGAGYAVLIQDFRLPALLTVRRVASGTGVMANRAVFSIPLPTTAPREPAAEQARAPADLALPLCPGAKVDYSVWVASRATAMARLEVAASGARVAGFYRKLAEEHHGGQREAATSLWRTTRFAAAWDDAGDRCTVTLLQPDSALPTVVWLQRTMGGGRP